MQNDPILIGFKANLIGNRSKFTGYQALDERGLSACRHACDDEQMLDPSLVSNRRISALTIFAPRRVRHTEPAATIRNEITRNSLSVMVSSSEKLGKALV